MNKEQILRNLDYIAGGIFIVKKMCENDKDYKNWVEICDEWEDIIFDIIDLIKEDYEECQKPLTNLQ